MSERQLNRGKCIAMAARCQILANALNDISAASEDIWTT